MKKILKVLTLIALLMTLSVTAFAALEDINGDGAVDLKDVTALRRYLAGGYGVELR